MVGKKEEFWIDNKKGDFFKDSNENSSYLIFFQQGYRDVLINESVIKINLKRLHTHVGVVCEYNSNSTYIGFVPGYCLGQTLRSGTRKKISLTAMRTRTFSQSVACRVIASDLGSMVFDDSATSTD